MNHPTVDAMREKRCAAIVVVDDLVGSGGRVVEYLKVLWQSRTIRSWRSRKDISFRVVSYSATKEGERRIKRSPTNPSVIFDRQCPTIRVLPWAQRLKNEVYDICRRYGARTSRPHMALGYRNTMATLIFEHGSPNNAPAILWAPKKKNLGWEPLFPARAVLPEERSAFPLEISRRDPVAVLVDAGQTRLAASQASQPPAISPNTLLVLAFAEKGIRNVGALSFATGLPNDACIAIMRNCVEWGFLTLTHRITETGLAELRAARNIRAIDHFVAPKGEENYYPLVLRKAT